MLVVIETHLTVVGGKEGLDEDVDGGHVGGRKVEEDSERLQRDDGPMLVGELVGNFFLLIFVLFFFWSLIFIFSRTPHSQSCSLNA